MKFIKICLSIIIACFALNVTAQRTAASKPQKTIGIKPPKLISSIGRFKDTMFIAVQDADATIGMPLKVADAKGVPYTLSSYQFVYRKIVATEDEQTGKVSNTTTIKASLFQTSPLPELWVNMIKENLRPGEEFIFFAIIAKDTQGRVFYAPDIKLTLK